VAHLEETVATPEIKPPDGEFDGDPQWAATTRRRVLGELADAGTLLIGTHFAAPSAGYIRRDGDTFAWEPC